jgi:hypothetical protein
MRAGTDGGAGCVGLGLTDAELLAVAVAVAVAVLDYVLRPVVESSIHYIVTARTYSGLRGT